MLIIEFFKIGVYDTITNKGYLLSLNFQIQLLQEEMKYIIEKYYNFSKGGNSISSSVFVIASI